MQKDTFLYMKAARYLGQLIVKNLDNPDFKFPTEAQLEDILGVSRITVRKAFASLEELNLVHRVKRGGTRINTFLSDELILSVLKSNNLLPVGPQPANADKTIAVIMPLVTGGNHIGKIVSAIVENAGNINVIFDYSAMSVSKEQKLIDKYLNMKVDGIILYPVDNEIYNPSLLNMVTSKFPLILVDRMLPGLSLPYVSSDHEKMMRIAVEHLLKYEHRHILYFDANIKSNSSLTMRKDSYINSLYNSRNYRPYFYTFEGDRDPTSVSFCEDFREFLNANSKITAIVAADYSSGLHLSSMLNIIGEPYKSKLDIVYLDFDPMLFTMMPPDKQPTYIMQDSYQIGAQAVKLMKFALGGNDISNAKVTIPVRLVDNNNK